MKKVLITLIILFVGFVGYSQEKTQYIGLPDNIVEVRNKLRVNALKDATGDSVWVSDAMGNAKLKAIQDFTGIKTQPDSLYLQSPIYSVKQLNDNGDTIQVVKFKIDSLPRLRYLALTRDTTTWDDTTLIDKGYLNDRLANISVSGSGDNIYTADGTLSGDRAVSLDGHLLTIGVETNNAIGMGEGEVIIGDFSGIGNSTYIDIQDGNQVVFINANNGIIYNTPPSGTSTDSILTWDADSKTIRKINRDSLSGSTPSLQDVTDVGASTTNNLTLNQANLSINDNGVTLFDTNDGSYAALYTTGTGGTGSGGRLQLSKESGGMATLEAANIGSSVTIQLPYILSGSGNLAEGITDGTSTVHANTEGIVDISSLSLSIPTLSQVLTSGNTASNAMTLASGGGQIQFLSIAPVIIMSNSSDSSNSSYGSGSFSFGSGSNTVSLIGTPDKTYSLFLPENPTLSSITVPVSINNAVADVDGNVSVTQLPVTEASADPTTADIPSGFTAVYKNTTSGSTYLWTNDGGTMLKVELQ